MNKKIILTGIIGIIASSLMYTGDMLLYFTANPIQNFQEEIVQIMANVSPERLKIGGLLGPISAFLYMIGFYHIYLLIKPNNDKLAKIFFGLLCFGMMYGGAFHTHFTFLGFLSEFNNITLLQVAEEYTILNFYFMFFPSLIADCLLAYLIITKKTFYPIWVVLFSPIILFWLSAVMKHLPQPLMMLIAGGWSNMIFIIFFSVSTILSFKNGYGNIRETTNYDTDI